MVGRPLSPVARRHSGSVVVAAPPQAVYALVSDVTRHGDHSGVVVSCTWDEPLGPGGVVAGDRFTGRNAVPGRTWETRCTVDEAVPGRRFSWVVGDGYVRWTYDLDPVDDGTAAPGTRLTETWEFLEDGIASFRERWGADADAQVEQRTQAAHAGIPVTLASLRTALEAQEPVEEPAAER